MAGEEDGDYHIQISETNDTFDNCLVVEVPKDDPVFVENSPDLVTASKAVRAFIIISITSAARETTNGLTPPQSSKSGSR